MIDQPKSESARAARHTCHELEYLLLGDLRQLLDELQTAQTRRSLLIILDRLLDNLPRQFALACEEGYMAEVLEKRPNWHRQIEGLYGANMAFISALNQLRNRIVQELPFIAIANEVSCDLREWIQSLVKTRGDESRLLQTAFSLDIGGEA